MSRLSKSEWRVTNKTALIGAALFTILMSAYSDAMNGLAGSELWWMVGLLAFVGYGFGTVTAIVIIGLLDYEKGRQPQTEAKWLKK